MNKSVIYSTYLCLFIVAIGLQLKYLLGLQMRTDAFSGFSFIVPGNLSYMAIGLLLMVEGILAEKVGTRTRVTGRLIVVLFLAWEIFKLPVWNKFSFFNEWGYIFSAASLIAAYFFFRSIWEIISGTGKRDKARCDQTNLE